MKPGFRPPSLYEKPKKRDPIPIPKVTNLLYTLKREANRSPFFWLPSGYGTRVFWPQ